ncbi:MAG: ATP-binding protein [Vicinamibacterales bacterium]
MRALVRVTERLSFRTKLTLSFVTLSVVTITVVSTLLTAFQNHQAVEGLRTKATRYASLLSPQLSAVVAFNDQLTAKEVFDSFAADPDVSGVAVYGPYGLLIAGSGVHPEQLTALATPELPAFGHVIVLAPVVSPEGPSGRLYISLTTANVEQDRRRGTITAVTTALTALALSVIIASLLSRAVALRVRRMADAANRIANGDLEQPDIEAGPADEVGHLARAFNSMVAQLRRQFADRALLAATEQSRLEELVATRTGELEESREQYRLVAESTNAIPFIYAPHLSAFTYVGPQAAARLAYPLEDWRSPAFLERLLCGTADAETVLGRFRGQPDLGDFDFECGARSQDGRQLQLRWVVTRREARGERWLHGLILDITTQRHLEQELAQSQKLESVGRLASGVAHEINTPVQFVSDSAHFLQTATADLLTVIDKLHVVRDAAVAGEPWADAVAEAAAAEADADLEYLVTQVPKALERCLDGLGRVTTIVRSMKEFAHPDTKEKAAVDLNRAIESTLTIARGEYKYVADLDTHFEQLPRVMCHIGDVNQAVLNIVINAAHAVQDVVKDTGQRGRITVATAAEGADVIIRIGDTGGGIPAHVADRIFDPFFTTKEVGRGTGQGLSIARQVIVDRHQGDLRFETTPGVGTTFVIRLPVNGGDPALGRAAA